MQIVTEVHILGFFMIPHVLTAEYIKKKKHLGHKFCIRAFILHSFSKKNVLKGRHIPSF